MSTAKAQPELKIPYIRYRCLTVCLLSDLCSGAELSYCWSTVINFVSLGACVRVELDAHCRLVLASVPNVVRNEVTVMCSLNCNFSIFKSLVCREHSTAVPKKPYQSFSPPISYCFLTVIFMVCWAV